jgi:hypothetical protein
MVLNEPKLHCNHETRFGQVASYEVHHPNGGGNLAFSHCGGTEKKWGALNLHGFLKIERCHEKKSLICLPFKEVLDMVATHEVYSFLDGFLGYH